MKNITYLFPAYGRKYENAESALKDWKEGKDFRILRGPYTSIRDWTALTSDYDLIYIIYGSGSEVSRLLIHESKPRKLIDKVL